MDEKLKEFLGEGEQVLWSGKAEPYQALDKTNGSSFWRKLVIALAVMAVLIVLYVMAMQKKGLPVKAFVIGVVVFFCLIAPLRFWTDSRALRKQRYFATDRRLIVQSDRMLDVPYEYIKEAMIEQDNDGHHTLLCGDSAVKLPAAKWRVACILCNINDTEEKNPCHNFVFYAVDDVEGLKKILKEKLPVLKL